ncbi:MAG TPA: hypothetical protein VE128_01745 [Candidatus Angelobacter sp.]|nr:hypothetical protein [Candidatus Angelobacter sp.]
MNPKLFHLSYHAIKNNLKIIIYFLKYIIFIKNIKLYDYIQSSKILYFFYSFFSNFFTTCFYPKLLY